MAEAGQHREIVAGAAAELEDLRICRRTHFAADEVGDNPPPRAVPPVTVVELGHLLVDDAVHQRNTIWYSPQGGGVDYPRDAGGIPSYKVEEQKILMPWLKGGGQATMNGPVYRYDAASTGKGKWPSYWDGKWFVGDFYDGGQPRHAVLTDPK